MTINTFEIFLASGSQEAAQGCETQEGGLQGKGGTLRKKGLPEANLDDLSYVWG